MDVALLNRTENKKVTEKIVRGKLTLTTRVTSINIKMKKGKMGIIFFFLCVEKNNNSSN